MDELRPEDLEGLVQELEGQSEEGEQPSPGVERLLQDLEPERPMELKVEAVRQLGELSSSNPQIVEALAAVSMWDTSPQLRKLAAASLLAPAHQAVIEQHPGLLPQHVKNLLREMEKGGLEEAIADQKWVQEGLAEVAPIRTDALLHALQHGSSARARARAAERLAQVDESNLEIVESLIAARDDDPFHAVRTAAAEALRAPVHEAVLQDDADLMRRAQQEAAPKDWKAEMLASPVKPERFRVEAEGDTLSLSWRDGALHKVLSAGLLLLLLLVFGYALFAGTYSGENVCVVALALLLPGYWVLVAFVNSTQITLSREEWIFLRGPFPFPNRRFYSGRIRIDPAAYREIRTVQVEEKRRSGSGSSSDIEGVIAEVLVGALLEQFMEPRITYSLYARTKDGSDKLLLAQLERHEAAYLRSTLQERLDARGGPQAGEAVAEVTARPVDLDAPAKESGARVHQECSQEHLDQKRVAETTRQQAPGPDWLKGTLSGHGRDTSVSRRRKPVSNFHIGLMISAGVVLLGISIAGVQADMPAGMPRTWQAKELMIYVQLLSLLCLLPGVVLSGWALWNWLAPWGARNVLRRSMKETSAVVCRAWREEQTNQWGGHTGYKYWVTISFQANDVQGDSRDILLKLRMKRPIWESLEADMTVTTRYAAENPRIALIQGEW